MDYLKKHFFSLYSYNYPKFIVGLMIESGYHERIYLKKLWGSKDLRYQKGRHKFSTNAKLLLSYIYTGVAIELVVAITLIVLGVRNSLAGGIFFGAALIIIYPLVWSLMLLLPVVINQP